MYAVTEFMGIFKVLYICFWRWWNIFKDDPSHKIPWLLDFVHLPYSHCNTKNSINLAWFLILNIKKSTSIPFSCATRDLLRETRIWTEAGGMFAEACQSLLRSCTSQMDITVLRQLQHSSSTTAFESLLIPAGKNVTSARKESWC